MAYPLRPFATGHPVGRGRKHSLWQCSFIVLKTVDQYEQLIVDPRASARAKSRRWKVALLGLASLAGFAVLVLFLLGLALFAGIK
jgi:hypothetical protein